MPKISFSTTSQTLPWKWQHQPSVSLKKQAASFTSWFQTSKGERPVARSHVPVITHISFVMALLHKNPSLFLRLAFGNASPPPSPMLLPSPSMPVLVTWLWRISTSDDQVLFS